MNGGWDIVGYRPYGGRQSLSHGLKASQFRSMGRSHIFQSPTYIQNNYYGGGHIWDCHAADPYCCGGDGGGMSKFTQWMMGIGMTLPLVGNILEMFMPKKAEGAGGSDDGKAKNTPEDSTLKSYQEAYKDKCTIVKISDNKYIITPKDGLPQEVSALNVDTINGVLGKKTATPTEAEPGTEGAGGTGKGTEQATVKDVAEQTASIERTVIEEPAAKDRQLISRQYNTSHGWYQISADMHTTNRENTFERCNTASDIADALFNSKTNGRSGSASTTNKLLIGKHKNEIAQAIIQANPNKFDANGNIKQGVNIKEIKIPDMQWIADNFGNGTVSSTGNGRKVKRNNNGELETYSHNGKKLKESYVNAKDYTFTDKNGKKWTIKYNSETKEQWYFDSTGQAVSGKDFKKQTGTEKLTFMSNGKALNGPPPSWDKFQERYDNQIGGFHNFRIQ